MPRRVLISQSFYFPWVGFLEQIRLADVYVHMDNVQFPRRSFIKRVQIKTSGGVKWLTIPVHMTTGQNIDEVKLDNETDWKKDHRNLLFEYLRDAPHAKDMLGLVDQVFAEPAETLADISRNSILALARYFDIANCEFVNASDLAIHSTSTERLYDIMVAVKGDIYITGHGAKNYLDHELFERNGMEVQYMRYNCTPYPQLHGEFTPFVTGLDLVANCGIEGRKYIQSDSVNWRDFIAAPQDFS
jgi:hypothetical protein